MVKTLEGAQLQHVLRNANLIIPMLWGAMLKPDRWMVGRAYSEVHAEGRHSAATPLSKILLKVRGFDYVPEDLRSRTFIAAARQLENVHFSLNNFYNEPAAISILASLGTVIPTAAISRCVSSVLCVRLGNRYGLSWGAQNAATAILSKLGEEQWKFYLDECLQGEEIILEKLTDTQISQRWSALAKEFNFNAIQLKDKLTRTLVDASISGKGRIETIAKSMLLRLKRP